MSGFPGFDRIGVAGKRLLVPTQRFYRRLLKIGQSTRTSIPTHFGPGLETIGMAAARHDVCQMAVHCDRNQNEHPTPFKNAGQHKNELERKFLGISTTQKTHVKKRPKARCDWPYFKSKLWQTKLMTVSEHNRFVSAL